MIQYLLLQNRQGKTRLSKYYRAYTDEERNKIESDVHRIVTTRDPKFTNFVEVIACSHKNGAFTQPPPKHRAVRSPLLRSTLNTSSFTDGTPASSSHCAWT